MGLTNRFIAIEGIEGSGKTTIVSYVKSFLEDCGVKNIVLTREPGSTPISEILRSLLQIGKDGYNSSIACYTELLLFYAARVQLLENVIKPALSQGMWVVGDRCNFSSYAYQGGGRGIDTFFIKYLSKVVLDNFLPDIVFYLDVTPEIGLSRIRGIRKLDRIEEESLNFFNRVRCSYHSLAHENSNMVIIDATQSVRKVSNEVCQYLKKWLYS